MATTGERKLHWMQRVALVRHNLHAASRTRDFAFFKTIQAQMFLEGTDYVASLNALLGDEADTVLHTLDDLNAGLAYVHQDSFKTVYDSIRQTVSDSNEAKKANIMVDASQQKQKADFAIDKMTNSAIELIEQQPTHCQNTVASVWIFGSTIIADAMKICIEETETIQGAMDNFICLEYAWQAVQTTVESAVSAIRGIFSLMAPTDVGSRTSRQASVSSLAPAAPPPMQSFMKRLSTAFLHTPHTPAPSRTTSVSLASPSNIWQSVTAAVPTHMPGKKAGLNQQHQHQHQHYGQHPDYQLPRKLSVIPPTPFYNDDGNPFELNFNS